MRSHRRVAPLIPFTRMTVATLSLSLGAAALITPYVAHAGEPSAREIMDKVTVARKLSGSEAVVKMTSTDEKGQTREREISMATKLFDDGKTEKRIYRFIAPADVKGTGVLVWDYEAKPDDMWIFLPATLRKSRRIVSSQRSQAFMGSEFSYGDLNIPVLDEFKYTLGKDDKFAGEDCWVVDAVPASKEIADAEGYSKKTYWVSKSKMAVVRGLLYDKDGKLQKEFLAKDLKLLDPKNKRYRAMRMEMVNKQNGRHSVFETKKVSFSPDTKDEFFTTAYLERG